MKNEAGVSKFLSVGYVIKAACILCLMSLVLLSSSCSIKTNLHTNINMDYALPLKDDAFTYWEVEGATEKILWDQIDFAFSVGYNIGEDEGELSTIEEDIPEISTEMWEVRASARWFPLSRHIDVIKPYVGFGVGYFDFLQEINEEGEYSHSDEFYDYYVIESHSDTIASGFFPFFSAGLYIPIGKAEDNKMCTVMQFEYRKDFDKEDDEFDLSGEQLTIGLGITWK